MSVTFGTWLDEHNAARLSNSRHPMDLRVVRMGYRALRAVSRGVNRILFSTDRDYDVLVGAIGLVALAITSVLVTLSVIEGW